MDSYIVTLTPSPKGTRVRVTHGTDQVMRAIMPRAVDHAQAVVTFLDGLVLWLDKTLLIVLCVAVGEASSYAGLIDEMGLGCRSLFYRVEVRERAGRRRRGARHQSASTTDDDRQLSLDVESRGQP